MYIYIYIYIYIYQNELDKACFQQNITYGDFKDLARTAGSDKTLRDRAFNIAKNPKYDEYQRVFASVVYILLDKETSVNGIKNENISKDLAEELHKTNC